MNHDAREVELRVIAHAIDEMRRWEDQLPPRSASRRMLHRMREELWREAGAPLAEQLVAEGARD